MKFWLCIRWVALASIIVNTLGHAATGTEEPLTVYVAFQLQEVDMDAHSPDTVFARFRMDYWWNPAQAPGWSPASLAMLHADGETRKLRVGTSPVVEPPSVGVPLQHAAFGMQARFKTFNDYSGFPIDHHDLALLFYEPGVPASARKFVAVEGGLRVRTEFASTLDGWNISQVGFYPDARHYVHSKPVNEHGQEEAFFGFLVSASRGVEGTFIRILLPMGIIWGLGYMGYFWRDSSPASRFGSSAMLSAVALSLGIRAVIPDVDYLVAIHVAFLGLYLCIAFDAIMVSMAFSRLAKKDQAGSERLRRLGIVASPCLALLVVFACILVSHRADSDLVFDALPPVIEKVR